MDTFDEDRTKGVLEAPLTLAEPLARPFGLASTAAFWWNLGISLLLPVAAIYVVLPNRPLWMSLLAIVVGAIIGGTLLGLAAAPGAREGVPAMVLLPWAVGFVAYQLTLPTFFAGPGAGWTAWWSARQSDLGIDPANGWSASLVSLGVAAVLTAVVGLPPALRNRRRGGVG